MKRLLIASLLIGVLWLPVAAGEVNTPPAPAPPPPSGLSTTLQTVIIEVTLLIIKS